LADCLKCKNCIRQEVYNGQWGMFHYTNICSVGVRVIINGKINPLDAPCDKIEYGEPTIKSITDEEKKSYNY
jgi:hypothetical protein